MLTCRCVLYECQLTAKPSLQKRVFLSDIQTDEIAIRSMYKVLNKRREHVETINCCLPDEGQTACQRVLWIHC